MKCPGEIGARQAVKPESRVTPRSDAWRFLFYEDCKQKSLGVLMHHHRLAGNAFEYGTLRQEFLVFSKKIPSYNDNEINNIRPSDLGRFYGK
jgi:hypothetical protein